MASQVAFVHSQWFNGEENFFHTAFVSSSHFKLKLTIYRCDPLQAEVLRIIVRRNRPSSVFFHSFHSLEVKKKMWKSQRTLIPCITIEYFFVDKGIKKNNSLKPLKLWPKNWVNRRAFWILNSSFVDESMRYFCFDPKKKNQRSNDTSTQKGKKKTKTKRCSNEKSCKWKR